MVDTQRISCPIVLVKCVELVLGGVCTGLIAGDFLVATLSAAKNDAVRATYFGFTLVSIIIVIGFILGTPIHGKLMMIIAAAGTILYITAAALNLEYYVAYYDSFMMTPSQKKKILIAGIIGLLNGCTHAVDVFLSWKNL